MRREYRGSAYNLIEHHDGWEYHEPVTGLRYRSRRFAAAMAGMHRLLIERRDELAARDPETLDAIEQRDLDRLRSFGDYFLRTGLEVGERAA